MKKPGYLLLVFLVMSLSACQARGSSTHIQVELSDFTINPPEITVPAGSQIAINVTNAGVVVHDFNIMRLGADIGEEFDDQDEANVYWKIIVQPDSTETAEFVAPDRPGVYQIICAMPGHMQAGMVGKFIVVNQP